MQPCHAWAGNGHYAKISPTQIRAYDVMSDMMTVASIAD
jgi:hypothetical protein